MARRWPSSLGGEALDSDDEIERRKGESIAEIFADGGEEAFRALEAAMLDEVSRAERRVLALGGGIVLRPGNRAKIQRPGQRRLADRPARNALAADQPGHGHGRAAAEFDGQGGPGRSGRSSCPPPAGLSRVCRLGGRYRRKDGPDEVAGEIVRSGPGGRRRQTTVKQSYRLSIAAGTGAGDPGFGRGRLVAGRRESCPAWLAALLPLLAGLLVGGLVNLVVSRAGARAPGERSLAGGAGRFAGRRLARSAAGVGLAAAARGKRSVKAGDFGFARWSSNCCWAPAARCCFSGKSATATVA